MRWVCVCVCLCVICYINTQEKLCFHWDFVMKCISQDWRGHRAQRPQQGCTGPLFALKSFCAWESKTWRYNPGVIHVILLIDGSFSQSHTTQSVREQFQTYSLPVRSFAHTAMTSSQPQDSWRQGHSLPSVAPHPSPHDGRPDPGPAPRIIDGNGQR